MKFYPRPLQELIESFSKLPGIGNKTAQRLAFYMINMPKSDAMKFSSSIINAIEKTSMCKVCQNICDAEICGICSDDERNKAFICVVAEPKDVIVFERTRQFDGTYHVLHGIISPLNNIGPEDIRIKELLERVKTNNISEIIVATNPDTEGEATAMYISRILKLFDTKITRLAYGIPVGGSIEFVDELTLSRAIEGRVNLDYDDKNKTKIR